ncbi:MAG TPA: penicillin-binding transpeptidase domain-containing protein, partial [Opitutaceae bacterium]|nr:penicillin-binding transpeptidase domain-containing protein [Opitutaceae bacterium]
MAGNLADQSGNLVESHKGYDLRIVIFYPLIALLLFVLTGGLAYQQFIKADVHQERERMQSHRRILVPGPRGNIYDRDGRLLVGNRPRFAVVLYLDELRREFRDEYIRIRKNYRESGDRDLPSAAQMDLLARNSVVQRYLDQVNDVLRRDERVNATELRRHFLRERLIPYTLIDDLTAEDYARLIESLPVRSPLQVYTSSTRHYPYGSAAAHTLGYTGIDPDFEAQDFPGEDLTTFKMKGAVGRSGLERQYDSLLQGEPGGTIFRVDPSGYKINPPIERRLPVQGGNLTVSLDIDLQLAAEQALVRTGMAGAAVALDVATGEVLALASKPDYDLNDFTPRLSHAKAAVINEAGAWYHRAIQGIYPPGSSFKILTAIAGLRSGAIEPDATVECTGTFRVGNRTFVCNNHRDRGEINLVQAIEKSCNTFFYKYGLEIGPELIAQEARRFHLDQPTGIELPHETRHMLVPDPEWKQRRRNERWFPGDTANFSIGQGDLIVTPLQMATFAASVARGQTVTNPTLLHEPGRTPQRSDAIGLTAAGYATLLQGMEQVVSPTGTARILTTPFMRIPGLTIAGKTGTAQKRAEGGKNVNFAWFICFAPAERPEIALAVMVEGDTPGEEVAGGLYAGPVVQAVLKQWWEKKQAAPARAIA